MRLFKNLLSPDVLIFSYVTCTKCRSQWTRGLRRGPAAARVLVLWVRTSPKHGYLSLVSVVFSGRGLCDGLITRPGESYRVWRVWVWSWSLGIEKALAHWEAVAPLKKHTYKKYGPELCSRYSDSLRPRRSGNRIPVWGEIFRTRPDRSWIPPSLQYNGYRVHLPGDKPAGCGVYHPPHLQPSLKKTRTILLLPLRAFMPCSRMNCTLRTHIHTHTQVSQ